MAYKKRGGNLYNPDSDKPFTLSRSKIDFFLECPRCFYLDRRLGLGRPGMPGWSLNSAVDTLLKKEFDLLRKEGQKHKLMEEYNIDAVPYNHPDLALWRGDVNQFSGIKVLHKSTNLEIDGLIDDIWLNSDNSLSVVDYKSTSTSGAISLEDEYKQSYKRQVEIYQWIFRQKGFNVSNMAYFVFANAGKNRPKFDGKLEFELTILSHKGDDSWVESTLKEIKKTLDTDNLPESGDACEYCPYRELTAR